MSFENTDWNIFLSSFLCLEMHLQDRPEGSMQNIGIVLYDFKRDQTTACGRRHTAVDSETQPDHQSRKRSGQ
jgi:hypothetical protein